jgi:hypothetical protein
MIISQQPLSLCDSLRRQLAELSANLLDLLVGKLVSISDNCYDERLPRLSEAALKYFVLPILPVCSHNILLFSSISNC